MGTATATIKEIRFVIEDELTQVYVSVDTGGDCPIGVQGWHHKTFPESRSVRDILDEMFTTDDCLLWPQEAPRQDPVGCRHGY